MGDSLWYRLLKKHKYMLIRICIKESLNVLSKDCLKNKCRFFFYSKIWKLLIKIDLRDICLNYFQLVFIVDLEVRRVKE